MEDNRFMALMLIGLFDVENKIPTYGLSDEETMALAIHIALNHMVTDKTNAQTRQFIKYHTERLIVEADLKALDAEERV